MADPAVRQRILRRIGNPQQGLARRQRLAGAGRHCKYAGRFQVRGSVDRQNARYGEGIGGVDRAEFGVGVRRAHEDRISLAGQRQIGGESTGPGQEGAVLDARHWGADQARIPGCGFARGIDGCHNDGFKLAARPATVAFLARPPGIPPTPGRDPAAG